MEVMMPNLDSPAADPPQPAALPPQPSESGCVVPACRADALAGGPAAGGPPALLDDEIQLLRALVRRLLAPQDSGPPRSGRRSVTPPDPLPPGDPHAAVGHAPARRRVPRRAHRGRRGLGLPRRATAAARYADVLARALRAQAGLCARPGSQLDEDLLAALNQVGAPRGIQR